MVHSKSRSKSSRSRSKSRSSSRSRSRSRSRKKRYSSRSRSRSYSRSRSRDRNHPRDYRRDFRVNRGMRRPYGFRNRGRGYYQGGRFHRGGFRPNWQNRRYSRSPRRGRSRSRTPKRRSASQRSRSKSHPSGRSSASRCSSSPSSSPYSRSPGPSSRREARSKATKQAEGVKAGVRPLEAEKGDGRSGQPVPVSSAKPEPKGPGLMSEGWMGISAYGDNSPRRSPSPVPTHPQISPGSHLSLCSRPMQRDSPAPCPSPGRSPGKAFSVPRGLFPSADDQNLPKPGRYFKRFLDEDNGKGNGRDGVPQTDRVKGDWRDKAVDPGVKTKAEKVPFLGDSPEVEEEDESQAYRQPYQFKVTSQAEARKSCPAEPHWPLDGQEEAGKYKGKSCTVGRELDGFGEDRAYKFKEPGYGLEWLNKGKCVQEDQGAERLSLKQLSAEREQERERLKDFLNKGPLLQSSLDMRNKASLQEENTARVKITPTEGSRPQVQIKILPVALDGTSPGTSAISDRSVASALAHSAKRAQGFRSIFDHIKRPQAYKSSAQSFIHHIVSLVHSVREHYFKSAELSLHERFTVYQKAAVENKAGHNSPEIHRRIDISPTVFKKSGMLKEDRKGEKKVRHVSASLRHDNDRRRTNRSCGRDDSRGSREPSPPRKADKVGKEPKDYKDHKPVKGDSKHKSKEREHSGSSSESSVSREEGKAHPEGKDYAGFQGSTRARGTFQFRIRGGRGRGRGVFSGPIPVPVAPGVPFQKRPKDEEWDPEYTPKSRKYFLHDDRDDGTDYWAKRGRGRGVFQRGRGCFPFKKSSSSPKWTHDKYQCEGTVEEEEETTAVCEERKDKQKEKVE